MRTLIATALITLAGASAVVPMSEEPFHRLVLKNDAVAVYDVVLPPGALMRFHAHPTNHLAVVIAAGVMQNEVQDRAPFKNPTGPSGTVVYLEAGPPHRQSNIGLETVHFVAVELLSPPPAGAAAGGETRATDPIARGCHVGVDVAQVRVWRCLVKPGDKVAPHATNTFLRIPLTTGPLRGAADFALTAGVPAWNVEPESRALSNPTSSDVAFVDIELK